MMDKKEAEKSLEEIKKHLGETEEDMKKMGGCAVEIHFLWGIFALVGIVLSTFFHDLGRYNMIWVSWILIIGICSFFAYGIAIRITRMTGLTSFTGKLIGMVWIGITISIVLAMFILWATEYIHFLESVIALFVGLGFFVEAYVTWREYIAAAVLCWIGAVIVGFFPDLVNLVFSILIFVTMIIPAIVFKVVKNRSRGK